MPPGSNRRRFLSIGALVALQLLLAESVWAAKPPPVRLAITTSLESSGLGEKLFPAFEKSTGHSLKIFVVGSGTALRMARTGEVDASITHAPDEEKSFIASGSVLAHRHVFTNDYQLLGPATDPAGVTGLKDIAAALRKIAGTKQPFSSRADDSGTHKFELSMWKAAHVDPLGQPWYEELGKGMGDTLKSADARNAYVLADRGSWLKFRSSSRLKSLLSGDERMLNRYVAIAAAAKPGGNVAGARALVEWLGSAQARKLVADHQIDGTPLFDLAPAAAR